MVAMAIILANIRENGSFEEKSYRPTHMYQICLCVINIVKMGDGESFFFTFLQFVHKIYIYNKPN